MPPLRIGIDVVRVESVADSIATHGDRYLSRVYTEREIAECGGHGRVRPDSLAARFAAKEAAMKVLRPADEALPWRDIEVQRAPNGGTEVLLKGWALPLAARDGIETLAVSLAHEGGWATAVVVATMKADPAPARPLNARSASARYR